VLMAETKEMLMVELSTWKKNMEAKELGVNVCKTKVIKSAAQSGQFIKSRKWQCAICL